MGLERPWLISSTVILLYSGLEEWCEMVEKDSGCPKHIGLLHSTSGKSLGDSKS